MNNTNNNSISSINGNKNHYPTSKNNLFNAKMTTFKKNTYLKEYAINQKMYLYKKNNESSMHLSIFLQKKIIKQNQNLSKEKKM